MDATTTTSTKGTAMATKPKFERIDEDSYRVFTETGKLVGIVSRGWWRNGGWGWTNDLNGHASRAGDTRAQAAADLIRRSAQ